MLPLRCPVLIAGDKKSKAQKPRSILARLSVAGALKGDKSEQPKQSDASTASRGTNVSDDVSTRNKRSILARISGRPGELKTAAGSTEVADGAPTKPRKNMLSRISAALVEPKTPLAAGEAEMKQDVSKRGMLGRISARVGEQKPPTSNAGEVRDDASIRGGKRGILGRMSMRSVESGTSDAGMDDSFGERKEGAVPASLSTLVFSVCP